jgi:perosamine synthetase
MTTPSIPVYRPDLSGNERAYLMEAFDSSWISSQGRFIPRFETMFAEYVGLPHVASVSNGTVALHLALHCLDLGPGDEVIVPSLTYIASVNTIVQTGATPVFAEVRESDWLLDPDDVERRITPRTRAVMPVHLYGVPCDMERLTAIADAHGLALVEDCAESLGGTLHGRHPGTFGRVATWSFFGNKTVTTGEGGMVGTSDPALHRRLVMTKGQGQDPDRRYWHPILGFNYRMTNLCAAIGTAQIERIEPILERKRRIAAGYRKRLSGTPVVFQALADDAVSSNWLVSILLPQWADRDRLMAAMAEAGIETRPVFYCAHHMPHHARPDLSLPISEDISARGICLPSYPGLTDDEVERVCSALRHALEGAAHPARAEARPLLR